MKAKNNTYRIFSSLLISLTFVLIYSSALSQNDNSYIEKTLSKKETKDLSDLAKYDKTVKKLKAKKRGEKTENDTKKVQEKDEEEIIPKSNFTISAGPLLTGILYVIIAALVVFILVTIFSSIKVDKSIKPEDIPITEDIEDIEVIDAESGLELALKAENYREAVRMLFIKLLQVLVHEDSIKWKPEKTNRDYLKEMNKHPKILHFSNLVIAYERIWYGSDSIDKFFFDYLKADFDKFYSTDKVKFDVQE